MVFILLVLIGMTYKTNPQFSGNIKMSKGFSFDRKSKGKNSLIYTYIWWTGWFRIILSRTDHVIKDK